MLGQTLGRYRIEESLGSGGMGTVYRAYDDHLERFVAIKFLNPRFAHDEDARPRILAEARAASALNHPNVCTVYEVDEAEGQLFLVMEYIPGRSLGTLIPAEGLPADVVLKYALDIAGALGHAHERGVLHRDLKSANIIITPEGRTKVLDFSLAERLQMSTPEALTRFETSAGGSASIGGTLAYLAPEVVVGQRPSVHSDIWALGVVLYEMACGTLPFSGRNTFELTAEILRAPVPTPPARVPAALRMIIQRCLAKDPVQRYARAGEVRAALEAISSGLIPPPTTVSASVSASRRSRVALLPAVAAVVALATGTLLYRLAIPLTPAPPDRGRLTMLVSTERGVLDPTISPDGKMITYVEEDDGGRRDLFVARVAGGGRVRLTDDDTQESAPAFSPDGERIAFTRLPPGGQSEICVVSALGGPIVPLAAMAAHPAWSPDGKRLAFVRRPGRDRPTELATTMSDGSDVRTVFTADRADPFIRYPAWSPDGRQLALVRGRGGITGEIWLIPANGGAPARLTDDPPGVFSDEPVFAPDGSSVIYVSNRGGATNLWMRPLEEGAPMRLTTGPGPDESPSVAANGAVAFLNAKFRATLITWDTSTNQARTLFTYWPYLWAPAFSPDGRDVAFSRGDADGSWHVWTIAAGGQEPRQVTSGALGEVYPRFTPDGGSLVYHTWRSPRRIWRAPLTGGTPVQLSPNQESDETFADVAADGHLVFIRAEQGTERSYVSDPDRRNARLLTSSPSTVPRWSPDGQWIAFAADRGYGSGIFIIRRDGTGERRLTDRGGWPVWWPDGRRVAYLAIGPDSNQQVQIVDVADGTSRPLPGPRFVGTNYPIDVSRDGRTIATSNTLRLSNEIWLMQR